MEVWLSHTLHLFARLLHRGANFLDRQGRRIEELAENDTGDEIADPASDAARTPGEPPAHWLEKVEASEDPVQWIHHTEEDKTQSPFDRSPLRRSSPPPVSFSEEEASSRESVSQPGEERRKDAIQRVSQSINKDSPHPTRPEHREKFSHRSWEKPSKLSRSRPPAEAPNRDHPSPPRSTRKDRDSSGENEASRPIRLQPSFPGTRSRGGNNIAKQSRNRFESETPENSENSSGQCPPSPPKLESPQETRSKDKVQSGSAPPRSIRTSSLSKTGAQARRTTKTLSSRDRPPEDRSSTSEDEAPAADYFFERSFPRDNQLSVPTASSSRIEPERRDFPSNESRVSSRNEEHSRDASTEISEHPAQVSQPYESRWPELPATEQILQENASTARRWTRWMRDRERRQRLNREHRGRLWNE